MSDFKKGDIVKGAGLHVFVVEGLTVGDDKTPENWLITKGSIVNPRFCTKYKGALSVLPFMSGYIK